MEPYHSEYGQDQWIHENIFPDKRNGVFVDVGALDGVFHSNTCFFEREMDWTGVCIEPNPFMFAELVHNRSCQRINAAVTNRTGFSPFLLIDGPVRGWSGITDLMEPEHIARIEKSVSSTNRKQIRVSTIPLDNTLLNLEIMDIDYLSIDVEGAEETIIKDFNFNIFKVDVLEVEINFGNEEFDEYIQTLGFKKLIRLGVSNIYRRIT